MSGLMHTSDFHYDLPDELIAQYPLQERTQSRMLVVDRALSQLQDATTAEFPLWMKPGDLLLLNDTQVIPARLFAHKSDTGGRVEIMVERLRGPSQVLAHLRASNTPPPGTLLLVDGDAGFTVLGREGDMFVLESTWPGRVNELLDRFGHMPLPPYIKRVDAPVDRQRYQTVFARRLGAVAAPTAGLHFSTEMMSLFAERGIELGYITLHVGAGTFQPVRTADIKDHIMHSEWLSVSAEVCRQVRECRERGGRVFAVGTTVVRALESASVSGTLAPYEGDTSIFIYPGHVFNSGLDGLLTNFHLPLSTLLMLVSAFAGRERIAKAYAHAVSQSYRFFSYGDAMLIY